ncbi:unnamed protein product [Closterium sp. NIES-53]
MSASQLLDLLGTPHAMHAVVDSSASDSLYSSVVSLGACVAEVLVASVGTCVDTSPVAASEDNSLSFTLDSGASHCFFRDHRTLTPLPAPVSIALAYPNSGPVTTCYTTTLPCPAVPSGFLTGFHVPSFSRNLVGVRLLVSSHVGVWIEPSGETAVCVDGDTYAPLATFTAEPGSGLYTLHTSPRQQQLLSLTTVTASRQIPPSHQVSASHQVAVSGQVPVSSPVAASCSCRQRLILGLPRVLLSLPPFLAPPCGPCVKGRLRATPHSSSLRPATEPFETLHLDVLGPTPRPGPERESFFLVVIDDYSRYTTMFPLAKKSEVTSTLIRWLLTTADTRGRRVSCLHSDCGESPQKNGAAERRINLVMEIARTSMIYASVPHFLWPYAVRYAAHQLNLWPRVSWPEASPTSLWNGSLGAASRFRVWGCLALVRDTSTDKLSPRALPCVFLGFPVDSSNYTFYHPPLHRFFDSRDFRFVESVPYYTRYPCRGLSVPPPPLFLTPAPPPGPPVQPPLPGSAPSGVSHATPPPSVAPQVPSASPQSSSQPTADPVGAGARVEDTGGATSRGVGGGAESVPPRGSDAGGAGVEAELESAGGSSLQGAGVRRAVFEGATTGGAGAPPTGPGESRNGRVAAGGAGSGGGATGAAGAGARGERVGAAAAGATAAGAAAVAAAGAATAAAAAAGAGAAAAAAAPAGAAAAVAAGGAAVAAVAAAATSSSCLWSSDPRSPLSFSSLLPLSSYLCPPCSSPSVLPSPPESALIASLPTPVTDYYRTYRPVLSRVLASLITDPRASLSSVSALTAAVTEFASTRRLDYATSLVAAPPTSPLAIEGEFALGCDTLEDRQVELELLAAASPHLCVMLLAPEGDPDALDISTPCTYAEAVSGPWASQRWPPTDPQALTVKRPPGSPLVFKARYVARGFSQREGVDFFQTFAPTPKMTTLRVLLHVAAQRDYELHSLEFSTAFLQGSLHEEVWLRRPSAFTGTFPPGTQWRLRRPVYGLRQAPREWHNTFRSTLSDLSFQPSSADPSLFVRRGSTPFFVLVYVDDLVFATADRVALADVKRKLQKRHTCTDLGELRHYLGLQITRDRAARTITLSQSHMVQQILQQFELQHSTLQRTPLVVDHRLTRPFPDEPFKPRCPCAELVGCLMYLMTCTRPDLAFPLSILARFVAPGRHRPVHWTAAVRVAKYLATTSGVGLVLGGQRSVLLTGHSDSSYADDAETHRSIQGYCFSLGSGAGPPIVSLVPARSALALYGPARTVSRCPAATRTACPPPARRALLQPARRALLLRVSRLAAACTSRPAALRVAPCCSQCVAPYCSQRVALCCPARRALLQPVRRALLQPARRALLPCTSRPAAASASRPTAASASHSAAPRAVPCCSQRVALCCPTRRALLPCTARALLPSPPRCPAATTTAAATRATAAAGGGAAGSAAGAGGAGGATGKAGGAAGAGRATGSAGGAACAEGAGPTTNRYHGSCCTTLTPLAAPVPVSLADPTGGPVVARQVAASSQVSASGQLAASCSCQLLSHQTLLWHHRLGHPSLPRLRSMHSRLLVSGRPRSLPSLPRSPAPPCLPCVEGRQRAAPHSSEFPPTTAPLQTLHMDMWGPAPVGGTDQERYFLLVVDDYTRYTAVFPLRRKAEVSSVLIPWIRATCHQLRERFSRDFPVLRLRLQSSGDEGIVQSFMLLASPQQNGIAERRIGLIIEVARTSMIRAAAPHFLWPFAVRYAAHQLNLWPRVSEPETSPTLRWTRKFGNASVLRVWGALSLVRDAKASKLSSRTLRCVFLGFPTDAPPWQFYHPRSCRVLTFEESVYPLHPQDPAPSGVSQVEPSPLVEPLEVSSNSSGPAEGGDPAADNTAATRRSPRLKTPPGFPPRPSSPPPQPAAVDFGAETAGAEPGGAETGGEGSGGAATGGAGSGGAATGGARSWGAATGGADSRGPARPSGGGAVGDPIRGPGAGQPPQLDLLETLSPQAICAWIVRRGSPGGGGC